MTDLEKLTIDQDDQDSIEALWSLINIGWSVVSAVYRPLKRQFVIKVSPENWPQVTIPCSGCGVRLPPAYLAFAPFPQDEHRCIACSRHIMHGKYNR